MQKKIVLNFLLSNTSNTCYTHIGRYISNSFKSLNVSAGGSCTYFPNTI